MMSGWRRPELGPEALWRATDPEAVEQGKGTRGGYLQTLVSFGHFILCSSHCSDGRNSQFLGGPHPHTSGPSSPYIPRLVLHMDG